MRPLSGIKVIEFCQVPGDPFCDCFLKQHVFDAATGARKDFVSGYSNTTLPNVWDRSTEVRATL